MAKRRRSLIEEEEVDRNGEYPSDIDNDISGEVESDYASEIENENEMSTSRKMAEDLKLAVKNIIRMAMSRNLKGQVIKREHMTQCAGINRVKFDNLLKEVNEVLEGVYGLSIQQMPNVSKNSGKINGIQNKAKQTYCVVSCLSNSSKQVLNELWSANINDWPLSRKLHENQYFLFKKINKEPMKNIELVKSGILLLILSVLVISENHLSEQELVKTLKRYGLSENLNIRNSNLNLNLYDLLSEFRKKDYIEREIVKGSTEAENNTVYYLGKRALTEFPPESMFEYLKVLYLDSFDELTAKKIIVTIERAYGVKLDIYELYNQLEPGSNNSDRLSTPDANPSQINSASETALGLPQPL